ncbi:MAG TPA: hypothetical protein VEO91_11740 [Candidatus Limnocylindria bacterium]|nr:hypothetical protein [Candidatus Limnocylindria bacterium]
METIHRILGYVAVVAVVVGIAWSVVVTRNPALGDRRFIRFQAFAVVLLIVVSVAGLGVLISGPQPKEGLHLVYAAIAMALLPLARSFVPATDRRSGIAALAAFVVLGFVLYRLFATG